MEFAIFKGYKVYEDGRVYSPSGYKLKFSTTTNGYYSMRIKDSISLHRLLAICFIPNPMGKPQINHINGIKSDNNIKNLEWCTSQENNIHALKTGLRIMPKGRKCVRRVPILQYDKEDSFIKEFDCIKEAGISTGINRGTISKVINNKHSTAGGFKWKRKFVL